LNDADRGMLDLIGATFGPVMAALDAIDLADLPLEPDLDPARAPRGNQESAPRPQGAGE
jgi:hypothetical protein